MTKVYPNVKDEQAVTLTLGEWTKVLNSLSEASEAQVYKGHEATAQVTWELREKIKGMVPAKYTIR